MKGRHNDVPFNLAEKREIPTRAAGLPVGKGSGILPAMAGWTRTILSKWLLNGLLFLVPLYVTWWVLSTLVSTADGLLEKVPQAYRPDTLLGFHLPGLGLAITVVTLITAGALLGNIFGRKLLEGSEALLGRIPFVRWFYFSSKEVMEAIFNRSGTSFQRVVLVEFPRPGIHAIGFVTSEAAPIPGHTGKRWAVFIPCTPNPTSGYLQIVPEEQLIPVDWPVDKAFRYVVSAGLLSPEAPGEHPLPPHHPLQGIGEGKDGG